MAWFYFALSAVVILIIALSGFVTSCDHHTKRDATVLALQQTNAATVATQSVCRVIEQCWNNGTIQTTAVFKIFGNGNYSGERYDIWKNPTNPILVSAFRGMVSLQTVSDLQASIHDHPGWTNEHGFATYRYGMMDYGRFDHPAAVSRFLVVGVPVSVGESQ